MPVAGSHGLGVTPFVLVVGRVVVDPLCLVVAPALLPEVPAVEPDDAVEPAPAPLRAVVPD